MTADVSSAAPALMIGAGFVLYCLKSNSQITE